MKAPLHPRSRLAPALLLAALLAPSHFALAQPADVLDVAYGSDPIQKLDVFIPSLSGPPAPLVVLVHGGGWWRGDKATDAPAVQSQRLRDLGYVTASINYRLTSPASPLIGYPHPAQIEDVRDAVAFLRANAATYRIDPNRVFLWGISAGGHLVSLAALSYPLALRGVIDLFGPTALGVRGFEEGLAWDEDIAAAGCPAFADCNPGLEPDPKACFVGQASAESNTMALAGCDLSEPGCLATIDEASPDLPANWAVDPPPPFLIVQHLGDCRVPPQQSARLANALGSAATLFLSKGNHAYQEQTDSPVIDAFLASHDD